MTDSIRPWWLTDLPEGDRLRIETLLDQLRERMAGLEREAAVLRERIERMRRPVEFLDQCKLQMDEAIATGALRDAHEWIESEARRLIQS